MDRLAEDSFAPLVPGVVSALLHHNSEEELGIYLLDSSQKGTINKYKASWVRGAR